MMNTCEEHPAETLANIITHGIGLFLSMVGFVILLVTAYSLNDPWRLLCCSVYGASLVVLYAASTFYHSFRSPYIKRLFRIIDHCAIYLLIAGSYTPFTLISLGHTPWGWNLFCIVWSLAGLGILFKIYFVDRFVIVSTLIYMLMGWLVVFAIEPLILAIPTAGLFWLFGGGLLYSLGVIFFILERPRFHHAIWHLFVLGGSVCHYLAIFMYVIS